ncbi:MAG: L-lactate permease [Nitriliruptorales bacterium]|nr:L-lactate permease [Nitriliruptorales bacterium]
MSSTPWWGLLVAVTPVVLLGTLVLRGRPLTPSAWISAAATALLAGTVFSLAPTGLLAGTARGVWTGVWILLIVLPALLLFEVLDRSGALDHLSDAAEHLAPTPGRRLLLLAWVLPSFLQGAAGFGTPIAMTAPMLVRGGMAPLAAVATCLIGYQWAVTFGSMGSSYFMASATARLGDAAASSFALRAGIVLAVSCVLSGLVVLWRAGGDRRADVGVALLIGCSMGGALILTVMAQPALGSTVAGLVGLVVAWLVLPRGGARPRGGDLFVAALPYAILTAAVTVAFGVPAIRDLLGRVPELAPVLPGSEAAFGFSTPASEVTPAFRPLLHPFPYLLLAAVAGAVVYRRRGWWPPGTTRAALRAWAARSVPVAASIVGLTVLASLMVESGMVAAIAGALAVALGLAFLGVSPAIGMFGTGLTGSTTASNALFSSLQADVATRLDVPAPVLLSAQTAGGNVGNALAPVNVAVGTAAAGGLGREGEVVRRNAPAAGLLLLAIVVATVTQAVIAGL